MRILITGGTGLLGRALLETAKNRYEIVATYLDERTLTLYGQATYAKLDIRDKEACRRLFDEFMPDVTIHTAGIGSPDYAERHKKESREINVDGTINMINNCERCGSKLIYISSNGIYCGNNAPYDELSEPRPINFYGAIKLEGERASRMAKVPYAIVRPILMYGLNHTLGRPNIVTYAILQLKKGLKFFAYNDVYVTPLFVHNCADAIWAIIEKERYETFNIGGNERVSIYELILNVARIFGLDESLVIPVQQGFFNELVRRPADTSYVTRKMQQVLGIKPISTGEGLLLMKRLSGLSI